MNSDFRILLAEPDEATSILLRRALERQGFTVVTAADGANALERFTHGLFNIVIASILMPQRDGLEVMRDIRAMSPETQFILLADPSSMGSAAIGLKEGAFAYLLKPVEDLTLLTNTVERAAEVQELRRRVMVLPPEPVRPPDSQDLPVPTAIRMMTQSMREGKPLAETLHLLAQSSAYLFDAPHAAILISRNETGLQLDSAFGYPDLGTAARDFIETVGDAFPWRVASERGTLSDSSASGTHFVGTPLSAGNDSLGVLVVYPLRDLDLHPERIALLESLATQGSLAVELARLAQQNEKLSPVDPVSGVLKRSAFLDLADREFRRSWRFNQPITAMIIDVDGMHEINARNGEQVGDQVLHRVATVLRNTVRSFDLIARYEQDAFAVLLIMTDRVGARGAAERLRHAISSIGLNDTGGYSHITTSLGTCTYPREGCASIFDLLDLAQTAQRSATRNGMNQVYFA